MEETEHSYKIIEIVGSSHNSVQEAIDNGLKRAAETVRHIRWFEVTQVRGHLQDGQVQHYQASMKIGFTLE